MSQHLNIDPTRRMMIPAHDLDNADGLGILTRIVSGDYSTAWWSCRAISAANRLHPYDGTAGHVLVVKLAERPTSPRCPGPTTAAPSAATCGPPVESLRVAVLR